MQRRAVVALIHMAPQRFGSAIHDVLQGTVVGWKHALAEPIKVGGTVVPENIRQLNHDDTLKDSLKAIHQMVYGNR